MQQCVRKSPKSDAKSILVTGHMDTVFDRGTAAARPFRIDGEKAYGPGVADMKSGITIALFALQSLYELGWDDMHVTVFFAGDEEAGYPVITVEAMLATTRKKASTSTSALFGAEVIKIERVG